ncbi:MAG: helicase-related protein [Candidatus Nanohaloarchaea archaeon]|nr:helicase-related protein [Candidatus Nanohaloarchaea archaeon]
MRTADTLKERERDLSLVFCRTKATTRWLADKLRKNGIDAQELNGDMSQHQREKQVEEFEKKNTKVIVATDVAFDTDLDSQVPLDDVLVDLWDDAEDALHGEKPVVNVGGRE